MPLGFLDRTWCCLWYRNTFLSIVEIGHLERSTETQYRNAINGIKKKRSKTMRKPCTHNHPPPTTHHLHLYPNMGCFIILTHFFRTTLTFTSLDRQCMNVHTKGSLHGIGPMGIVYTFFSAEMLSVGVVSSKSHRDCKTKTSLSLTASTALAIPWAVNTAVKASSKDAYNFWRSLAISFWLFKPFTSCKEAWMMPSKPKRVDWLPSNVFSIEGTRILKGAFKKEKSTRHGSPHFRFQML